MKAVFIGSDPRAKDLAATAVELGWADASFLPAAVPEEGLELIEMESPDVVLLHPDFPNITQGGAIMEIRHFTSGPLLVMGCRGDVLEVVTALELGSDDYVRVPCDPTELMVRIRALLRRSEGRPIRKNESPLSIGPLTINPATYGVFLENHRVALTPIEFRLLYLLVSHRGAVVTHSALEQSLWGDRIARSGSAKKYVQQLRRKLGDNPTKPIWIANVPRVGYRFLGPGPVPVCVRSLAA